MFNLLLCTITCPDISSFCDRNAMVTCTGTTSRVIKSNTKTQNQKQLTLQLTKEMADRVLTPDVFDVVAIISTRCCIKL
jgi:hypothetical protein